MGYLAQLDSGGRVLFLLPLGIPDFDDSPRETLPCLRSEQRNVMEEVGSGTKCENWVGR